MSYRRDYPEAEFAVQIILVMVVSAVVEVIRYRLHPDAKVSLLVAGFFANIGYHVWSTPETYPQTAVSAVLGEASMPVVIGLVLQLVLAVMAALVVFLNQFLAAP